MTNQLEQLKAMRADAQAKIEQSPEYLIIQSLDPLINQLSTMTSSPLIINGSGDETGMSSESVPVPIQETSNPIVTEAPFVETAAKSNDLDIEIDDIEFTLDEETVSAETNVATRTENSEAEVGEDDEDEESLSDTLRRLSQSLEGSTG